MAPLSKPFPISCGGGGENYRPLRQFTFPRTACFFSERVCHFCLSGKEDPDKFLNQQLTLSVNMPGEREKKKDGPRNYDLSLLTLMRLPLHSMHNFQIFSFKKKGKPPSVHDVCTIRNVTFNQDFPSHSFDSDRHNIWSGTEIYKFCSRDKVWSTIGSL